MRKIFTFLLLSLTCTFVACKDPVVTPDEPKPTFSIAAESLSVSFNDQKGIKYFTVTTNQEFSAIADKSWCTVNIISAAEKYNVEVIVPENLEVETRTAKITVSAVGFTAIDVTVSQLGTKPTITVKESEVIIPKELLTFSLEVTSNIEVAFELPSWINLVEPSRGSETFIYNFIAEKLEDGTEERSGNITVKAKDASIELTPVVVAVTQLGITPPQMPRFAVLSDIHHGRAGSKVKVTNAIKDILAAEPAIEAIFVVGDITESGTIPQYDELLSVWKDPSVIPQDLPVYFMMGNHDNYSGDGKDGTGETNFKTKLDYPHIHTYVEIGGHGFICVSERGKYENNYYQDELDFIKNNIATANSKFPGKPVFVFAHVGVLNTCYGTESTLARPWGTDTYKSVLIDHPEVILFSGHSHFPVSDPRSLHQDKFTAVNVGGGAYGEIESGYSTGIHPPGYNEVTEAIIVSVLENGDVELTRRDTYRNEEISPKWVVEAPHDGSKFKYTTLLRNKKIDPIFAGANVVVTKIGDFSCTIDFPAATDDEKVFMYQIKLFEDSSPSSCLEIDRYSGLYFNSLTPKNFSVELNNLAHGTNYKVTVVALDSYLNMSNIISTTFSTTGTTPVAVTDAPVADLLDIVFNNKGALDRSLNKHPIATGPTPPTVGFEAGVNTYLAKFPNSNKAFYKFDYENDAAFKGVLSSGFTLETYYMTTTPGTMHSPVSSQESGGFGFESSGSKMIYWISNKTGETSKAWVKPTSTNALTSGAYYHLVATYSGTTTKLYLNGELQQELPMNGLSFGEATAQWLCVGGDANISSREASQSPLNGNVAFARMYTGEVPESDVMKLYRQTEYRRYISNAKDLATHLITTLPAKAIATPSQAVAINATIEKGWKVMNNYNSTREDFNTIITECQTY